MLYCKNTIGGRIRFVRTMRKLTLNQLAITIEITRGNLNKIELDNTKNTSAFMIRKIADALNCTTDFLLCRADQFETYTYADAMAHYLQDLEPINQEICMVLVRKQYEAISEVKISKIVKPVSKIIFTKNEIEYN